MNHAPLAALTFTANDHQEYDDDSNNNSSVVTDSSFLEN
jgi:hypothetical protein